MVQIIVNNNVANAIVYTDEDNCCLCGVFLQVWGENNKEGNNPYPLMFHRPNAICCDVCYNDFVIPLKEMYD